MQQKVRSADITRSMNIIWNYIDQIV